MYHKRINSTKQIGGRGLRRLAGEAPERAPPPFTQPRHSLRSSGLRCLEAPARLGTSPEGSTRSNRASRRPALLFVSISEHGLKMLRVSTIAGRRAFSAGAAQDQALYNAVEEALSATHVEVKDVSGQCMSQHGYRDLASLISRRVWVSVQYGGRISRV
jgi:hypothetical protein